MRGAACSHTNLHISHYCSGPSGPDKVGANMPMHVAACNRTHWHTCPLLVWATWPNKRKGKYANACGCMQPHALAYFPILSGPCGPEQSMGKVRQCVWLHAAPRIGRLSPYFLLGHMAQTSRGRLCQCVRLHAAPRIGILVPYLSEPCGSENK